MTYTRTGIILLTEHYEACIDFYTRILELPIMHSFDNEYSKLTCCDMGHGNYLMIETGGVAVPGGKSAQQNPIWLRFNVDDVDQAAQELRAKGVEISVRHAPWGTVADFANPNDGICNKLVLSKVLIL